MLFQITQIEFDFEDDSDVDVTFMKELTDDTLSSVWEADDEDLQLTVEMITEGCGWLIKDIEYLLV